MASLPPSPESQSGSRAQKLELMECNCGKVPTQFWSALTPYLPMIQALPGGDRTLVPQESGRNPAVIVHESTSIGSAGSFSTRTRARLRMQGSSAIKRPRSLLLLLATLRQKPASANWQSAPISWSRPWINQNGALLWFKVQSSRFKVQGFLLVPLHRRSTFVGSCADWARKKSPVYLSRVVVRLTRHFYWRAWPSASPFFMLPKSWVDARLAKPWRGLGFAT